MTGSTKLMRREEKRWGHAGDDEGSSKARKDKRTTEREELHDEIEGK